MSETKDLALISSRIEQVLMAGDLAPLSSEERVQYHNKVCQSLGLNPVTKPFEYIKSKSNGKIQLYAKKDATDQLRRIYGISIKIINKDFFEGLCIVTAQAEDKTGRCDESTGIVNITGLKGTDLANELMKAETKAKRRVTLSICGLGMLDESEIDDVSKEAKDVTPKTQTQFLPKNTLNYNGLLQAFMGLGISKDEILQSYGVDEIEELDESMFNELRQTYKLIQTGEKTKEQVFGPDWIDEERGL